MVYVNDSVTGSVMVMWGISVHNEYFQLMLEEKNLHQYKCEVMINISYIMSYFCKYGINTFKSEI